MIRNLTSIITCVHCGMRKHIGMVIDDYDPPDNRWAQGVLLDHLDETSRCCPNPMYYMHPEGVGIFKFKKNHLPKKIQKILKAYLQPAKHHENIGTWRCKLEKELKEEGYKLKTVLFWHDKVDVDVTREELIENLEIEIGKEIKVV